jgi:pimeloyl-ACP methyl ester carboxylesterase
MALDHLTRIRSIQAHGPYSLVGHCVGGLIAFEMARQLRAQDEKVELLIMIDPPYSGVPRPRPPVHSWRPEVMTSPRVRSLWILNQYTGALHAYKPRSYPGKVTLLWAMNNPFKGRHPRDIFQQFAQEVDFRWIPGTHESCLGRHVGAAGVVIRSCMAACTPSDQLAEHDIHRRSETFGVVG